MSAGRAFFDTNILIYMSGRADDRRRQTANDIFERTLTTGELIVSTQVVQEFYAAGLRKLGIPRRELRALAEKLLGFALVTIGAEQIRSAMDLEDRYSLSFWDALIVAAAISGGAEVLYSEDFSHGQQYGPVTVRNPFREP